MFGISVCLDRTEDRDKQAELAHVSYVLRENDSSVDHLRVSHTRQVALHPVLLGWIDDAHLIRLPFPFSLSLPIFHQQQHRPQISNSMRDTYWTKGLPGFLLPWPSCNNKDDAVSA